MSQKKAGSRRRQKKRNGKNQGRDKASDRRWRNFGNKRESSFREAFWTKICSGWTRKRGVKGSREWVMLRVRANRRIPKMVNMEEISPKSKVRRVASRKTAETPLTNIKGCVWKFSKSLILKGKVGIILDKYFICENNSHLPKVISSRKKGFGIVW